MKLVSDPSQAKKVLGWEATVGLDEGLRRTIDWMRQNLERFKPEIYNL